MYRVIPLCLAVIFFTTVAPDAGGQVRVMEPTGFAAEVDEAIRRGVDALYAEQNEEGTWETSAIRQTNRGDSVSGDQWGGLTALATYTLLAAGENPLDPRIVKAVDWLRDAEIIGIYAIGCRAQSWRYLPPTDENKQAALRDAKLLLAGVQRDGDNRGLYDYTGVQSRRVDLSVSQYGVLGMWACSEYVEIPTNYWQQVQQAWLGWQQSDGGWAYRGRPDMRDDSPKPVTMSMTVAGIATLYITQDFIFATQPARTSGNLRNPAIDKALELVIAHYPELIGKAEQTPFTEFGGGEYALYGVERIGVASGFKYFGELDWYDAGARYFLEEQNRDGGWGRTSDTCFALLFLSRGREPVMMNKAQYVVLPRPDQELEGNWNQRPRDVANAARWVGKQTERTLNWQVIDLKAGTVRDLHDAPILYLSGNQPLALTDDAKTKIKQYILEGGMLVFNADGGARRFEQGTKELGTEFFADAGYTWRVLPDDHPIYTEQQYKVANWRRKPQVQGLSNGVRELMILLPGDTAATWQTYNTRKKEEDFQLIANIYLYAIDKDQTYYKGNTHLVEKNVDVHAEKTISVARIRHGGNWNPEPAGWDQLAAVMHNDDRVDLEVTVVEPGELDADATPVAHLTGTDTLESPELGEALKAYVDAGGTLVIDAAGGSGAFAQSVETVIAEAFGEDVLASLTDDPLPADHPLYQTGGEVSEVDWRLFARSTVVGNLDRPRLRGAEIDGRLAIIYSAEDLSAGLVGAPVDGILGYTPATAQDLMRRIMKFTAK